MDSNSFQNPPPQNVLVLPENQGANLRPPPAFRHDINSQTLKSKRLSRTCCCRCMWCCYCFIFFGTAVYFSIVYILYAKFAPKIPLYEVDHLSVHAFNIQPDNSLFIELNVTIEAKNPNKFVGLMNSGGGRAIISYSDSDLCSGKLTSFYQPGKSTTVRTVVLEGNSPFGSELQETFMKNKHAGKIPLLFRLEAPVSFVLGDFPLKTVNIYLNSSVVVDNLSPNKKVRILTTQYMYDLKFNWY
ncbi:NDR1/HIN1-like protein 6 [Carya illinoinensis]|uniref:Late embryogenesis abundant protein LEA-2 subgroup domain-containing protein n=1 Tax=Carya illinoinensis TaxID=32201 RepID=A0A8T1R5P7_CARIL|nr:NDR1/HIN1-like protein 6 [Carya illinoinensis]KAG6661451.1 hypothetical protein CIPAW_03G174300 [Carya illinoinensis]